MFIFSFFSCSFSFFLVFYRFRFFSFFEGSLLREGRPSTEVGNSTLSVIRPSRRPQLLLNFFLKLFLFLFLIFFHVFHFLFFFFCFSLFFVFALACVSFHFFVFLFFFFACVCFHFFFVLRFFTSGKVKCNARHGRSRHRPKFLEFVKLILRPKGRNKHMSPMLYGNAHAIHIARCHLRYLRFFF